MGKYLTVYVGFLHSNVLVKYFMFALYELIVGMQGNLGNVYQVYY